VAFRITILITTLDKTTAQYKLHGILGYMHCKIKNHHTNRATLYHYDNIDVNPVKTNKQ